MKKLLLVLTVVAMASFLFVGCDFPGAPPVDPPVEPPVEPTAITATIGVATETAPNADGKIFVKGGSREITVTFSDVVENPVVKVGTVVVPLFTVDNKVFKGPGAFVGNGAVLITVGGVCDDDLCEAKSVVVDSIAPVVELEAKAAECDCEDSYALTITSEQKACDGCVVDPGCCEDAGSGVASWNVQIFDANPWEIPYVDPCTEPDCEPCCSEDPCIDPIAELDGTACPITITTECIDEVWTEVAEGVNDWVGYFDKEYFVIATLTDNVGNKTTYKGLVSPSTVKADNYVSYFAEIYHGADTVAADYEDYLCWCYAEDETAADSVLGDCDGFPATECWEEKLDSCPIVFLWDSESEGVWGVETNQKPLTAVQGQEYWIGIWYEYAEKPESFPAAYIGPAIKGFAEGIPDDAQELTLVEYEEDMYYEGPYTFGQAGTDYIYVTDGTELCKYAVEVAERVCPTIVVDDAELFEGEWWVDDDDHDVTITFTAPIPIEKVRAFRVGRLEDEWDNPILPEDAQELILSTEDDLVYTATARFTSHDDCDEDYIIVQYGESCCPVICTEMFMVDDSDPYAALVASAEVCDIECDTGIEIEISKLENEPACEDPEFCCGDDCTEVVAWDLTIYMPDFDPFTDDGCCDPVPSTVCDIFFEDSGLSCDDLGSVTPCIPAEDYEDGDGDYPVIFKLVDLVGNETTYYGVLTIGGGGTTAVLNNSTMSSSCPTWNSNSSGFVGETGCF